MEIKLLAIILVGRRDSKLNTQNMSNKEEMIEQDLYHFMMGR